MDNELKGKTNKELQEDLINYTEQIFEFQKYIDRLSSACDDVYAELVKRGCKIKTSYKFIKTRGKI